MNTMLLGAIAMACFTASLFFLRFWKTTHDRFFLFFAISFFVEGCSRTLLALNSISNEQEPLFYFIRLIAYLLIIVAILDKNWTNKHSKPKE
jgi:uncharacterized membrane protein HdeD (DUF308 family)